MKLPRHGSFVREVLDTIQRCPGIVSVNIARLLKPTDDAVYGFQRRTSSAIAELRKRGLLEDVKERCRICGCAKTRNSRNVALRLTPQAREFYNE